MDDKLDAVVEVLFTIGQADAPLCCMVCLASQCKKLGCDPGDPETKKKIMDCFCRNRNDICLGCIKDLSLRLISAFFHRRCLIASQ